MGKTYVDMEDLENLFREYNIPYTNIFDEIRTVSAEEIAEEMSVSDLRSVLENRDGVFATQIWVRDDIYAAMRALQIQPDECMVTEIIGNAQGLLEDCSDNWDKLHRVIKECTGGKR